MKLTVIRKYKKETYTIGELRIDGTYFCSTLEDKDRGLKQSDPIPAILAKKVYGETAIPVGTYKVLMNVVSHKYSAIAWYKSLCGGKLPRLDAVPAFNGVLIHPGNTALDCLGCILVGENKIKGKLINSRATFAKLYAKLKEASDKREAITIEIV